MTSTITTTTYLYPHNLEHDPNHTLDGMLVIECLFCEVYRTPIEFDMYNHLREAHHKGLLTRLPIYGTGYNMDYRARLAIDMMKDIEPKVFYDHTTATFAPPFIPVSAPPKYRAYDKYKVKKEVVSAKNPKMRKETCLLNIGDSQDLDNTVTKESG